MVVVAASLWGIVVGALFVVAILAWIVLVVAIFIDIFRDEEMPVVQKVLWAAFVLLLPWLGVVVYLTVRSDKMQQNRINARSG